MSRIIVMALLMACPLVDFPWPEVRPSPQAPLGVEMGLEGAWRLIEKVHDGFPLPPERIQVPIFLIIEDDRYIPIPLTWEQPQPTLAHIWKLVLDPSREPKALELTLPFEGGREGEEKVQGIYRLDGDRLTICTGPTRPADFSATKGSGRTRSVYRRVVPTGPAARPVSTAAAEELARLAGIWAPIRSVDEGYDRPAEEFKDDRFMIEGNRLYSGEVGEDGRVKIDRESFTELALDPGSSPKAIDYISRLRIGRGNIRVRWIDEEIYRLDGDTLTTCGDPRVRPTEFSAPKGSFRLLTVNRRTTEREAERPRP